MRVETAFKRLLGIAGVSVAAVRFEHDEVVVTVRLRREVVCSRCGPCRRSGL